MDVTPRRAPKINGKNVLKEGMAFGMVAI